MQQCGRIWEVSRLTGDVDFMIRGIFSYELFGHTVWITTSHVCIFIVMLPLLIFAMRGEPKPCAWGKCADGISERGGAFWRGKARRHGGRHNGKRGWSRIRELYWHGFSACPFEQHCGTVWIKAAPTRGLWNDACACAHHVFFDPTFPKNKEPERRIYLERTVFPAATVAATLGSDRCDEYGSRTRYSLSLRLLANVLSGTVMLALVYGLLGRLAFVWPAALHIYFDLFSGAIQTYVFCMLTMTYIGQNYEAES